MLFGSRGCREDVVVGVVEAECPADGLACGARGWRHAEEVAAVAAVWFGGRVDDLHELDALAVDPDRGRPQLAVVVLGAELGARGCEEALPAQAVDRDAP